MMAKLSHPFLLHLLGFLFFGKRHVLDSTRQVCHLRIVMKRLVFSHCQFELNLADISEVWRRGSVIASWLLDLTADALAKDSGLAEFVGRVSDPGEGRRTIKAAIDEGVPAPVLTTALYERFSSRGDADFQGKLLSAMRYGFVGHLKKFAK